MNGKIRLFIVFLSIVAIFLVSLFPTGTVYGASGTSSIQVSPSALNVTAGGSIVSNFTDKLTSGSTWGTTMEYKSSSGISASFSPSYGDPTFKGTMKVSVSSSVSAGAYTLTVYATGDDPAGDTNITVNVAASAAASGTSTLSVSSHVLNITAGGGASENYSVGLSSGSSGTTTVGYRTSTGITATFTVPTGNPTFNGSMTVAVASSVSAGTYILNLYATGADPSSTTNITINVALPSPQLELLALNSQKTEQISASSGNSYTVSVNTPGSSKSSTSGYYGTIPSAIASYTLTAIVPAGTYAKINGTMVNTYNFTLATFNQNSSFPSLSSNYTVDFLWVFEVNGQVSANISFVNSSGNAVPITTEINAPSNWTSYTYLGGGLVNNGQSYNFNGGSYAFPNMWTYNSTSHELVNTQFYQPVPWVFVQPAASKVSPHSAYNYSWLIYVIIVVVVIIIIVGVIAGIRSRKGGKK